MKTAGLIEIIVYVADMDAQVQFYRDVFELAVMYPAELDSYADQYWVTLDAGGVILALHGGGQGRLGADTPKIVFGVDNIHAARAELVRKGVSVDEVRSAAPGVWVCDGRDPEGNPFSIESHD
ncbi:VOC family protein [Candidatus Leptofilum sp.]|uniref:VOC family protein n=1 Tax=Candidatus Leptofilum sp. TaxID=3241576 RepID=UPI003B5B837E